jgi:hypothetical protein
MATPRSSYVEVKSTEKELRKFQSTTPRVLAQRENAWSALEVDILSINATTILQQNGNLHYLIPIEKHIPFRYRK